MGTLEPMLSPGPLAWEPLVSRRARRWELWALPLLLVMATVFVSTYQLPSFILSPGTARQVNDLVQVPDDKAFPPKGRVLLTTVSLLSRPSILDALKGWLDPDEAVYPEEQILGSVPRARLRQVNLQAMDESVQTAIVVALRRLGYAVAEHGDGAIIEQTIESGDPRPISVGDVILAIDGVPMRLTGDVQASIRSRRPGDVVTLDLEGPTGARRKQAITLLAREDGTAFLGVGLRTRNQKFDLPFKVDIASVGIGGPSAGLAYTLAVLDTLTPGELTAGRKVAVTGTIEIDGRVGDVGGVTQKTAAVRAAGAEIFLVPPGEYEEAVRRAGSRLKVVKVASLEEAITALGRLGGDVSAFAPGAQRAAG